MSGVLHGIVLDNCPQFSYEDEATTWLLAYLRETYDVWLRKESDTGQGHKSVDVRGWHKGGLSIAIEVKMYRNKAWKNNTLLSMLEPHQALDLYQATMRGVDTYIVAYHTHTFTFYIYSLCLQENQLKLLQ